MKQFAIFMLVTFAVLITAKYIYPFLFELFGYVSYVTYL